MTLDEFLGKLEGVETAGAGYKAICPAHDDRKASLSIHEGDDGRVLIKCMADCTNESVVAAMGLGFKDLFPNTVNYAEAEAVYQYHDESRVLLFESHRFPGKKFRQRHLDDQGEWHWTMPREVRRVLYRLPDILDAVKEGKTIFVVEGEKDAEALWALGHPATCNPMGAGKWRPEHALSLAGANVVIVQDKDEPGRNHAQVVKESLLGLSPKVWVYQARKGKDVSDHLAAGLGLDELDPARELPREGVYTTTDLVADARERLNLTEADLPSYDPFRQLSEHLTFRNGRIYLCGGYTGDGKTAFALQGTRQLCSDGARVGYGSLEMNGTDLMNRLLCHKGIPLKVLERPWEIPGSMWETMWRDAVEEIASWNLDVMFKPGGDSDYFVQQTINGEYDFLIIDHIHRFTWGSERRKLEEELGKLTNLALTHNIVVFVLAQFRRFQRGPGMETYPRPILQDFRETEAFGNESARAMAIWRMRDSTGTRYADSGGTEIITLKDRYGPMGGSVLCQFDGPRQLFVPSLVEPDGAGEPVYLPPGLPGVWGDAA